MNTVRIAAQIAADLCTLIDTARRDTNLADAQVTLLSVARVADALRTTLLAEVNRRDAQADTTPRIPHVIPVRPA